MKKTKTEKQMEVAQHATTTLREILLGFIPGGHVLDSFLSFRSKLKEKRLMKFMQQMQQAFESELNYDLENYNFNNEDFVDLLESILKKVLETKSELKLIQFRNILTRQIVSPTDNLVVNNYVRLVNELNEIELIMLDRIPKVDTGSYRNFTEKHLLHFITTTEFNKAHYTLISGFNIKIGKEDVFVSGRDLAFYINDLVSKGLLSRVQTGTTTVTSSLGGKQLEYQYLLTQMGIDFLQFIELFDPNEEPLTE